MLFTLPIISVCQYVMHPHMYVLSVFCGRFYSEMGIKAYTYIHVHFLMLLKDTKILNEVNDIHTLQYHYNIRIC